MLLQEKKEQVSGSEFVQDDRENLSELYRWGNQEIDPPLSGESCSTTVETNGETLSPINLIKLLTILAIGSMIVILPGMMNNFSCGINSSQNNTSTVNIQ